MARRVGSLASLIRIDKEGLLDGGKLNERYQISTIMTPTGFRCLSRSRARTRLLRYDHESHRLLPFPITLCALLYALCVFTVPYTDSIGGANQFLGGFLFFGRLEIQDTRTDHDELSGT